LIILTRFEYAEWQERTVQDNQYPLE